MTDVRFTRVLPGRRLVGQGAGKNAEATLPHPPWRLRGDVCFVTIHGLAAAERNDIQPFKIACGNGPGVRWHHHFIERQPCGKRMAPRIVTLLSPKYKRKG